VGRGGTSLTIEKMAVAAPIPARVRTTMAVEAGEARRPESDFQVA
jgi:hypothetical protein